MPSGQPANRPTGHAANRIVRSLALPCIHWHGPPAATGQRANGPTGQQAKRPTRPCTLWHSLTSALPSSGQSANRPTGHGPPQWPNPPIPTSPQLGLHCACAHTSSFQGASRSTAWITLRVRTHISSSRAPIGPSAPNPPRIDPAKLQTSRQSQNEPGKAGSPPFREPSPGPPRPPSPPGC
jgi:hypothetical protein